MHQYEQRVDIMDDGRVVWVDGNLAHGWLSLDGIVWAPNTYKIKTAAPLTKAFTTGSVPFLPGWKPVGDLYRDPQYARWNSVCMLSGLVANADNLKAPIAKLPEDCRPGDGTHIFNSHSSASNTLRVDVGPSGKVFWNGGDQVSDFIGLDGIIFTVSGTRRIDLHLNQALYRNFENDYAAASYSLEGDLCVVQGLVRDVNQRNMQGGLIGYLPPDCRPQDGRLIFSLNHNQFTHRVDVLEDGTVYYITGSSVNTWISLDGVAFTTSASQQVLAGLNGWQPYQNSYRAPSYKLVADGAVCVLSGLWSAGSGWTVTVLPTSCRPSKRLTFWVNHHSYNTRLDILPDGRVMFKAGWLVHGWVPFDGIRFTADQGPDPAPSASKVVRATNATALQLSAGITNFGQGYEPATYQRLGDLCVVQGMLATGDQMMQVLATLPADCRPAASLIFAAQTADSNQARVDVTPAGEVRWVAGSSSGGWLSLSGIQFVVAGAGVPLPLRLDWQWVALGRGYKEPEFQLVGSLCIVSGVVRTDNMLTNIVNSEVARLPSDCTPRDGRLIFRVNQNQFTRRLDAVQDGRLVVSDGSSWSHPWMSLEGVRFVATEGGAQPLDLASGWDHYYNDYRKGSWHKEGNLCIFSGLINSGSRPALIVTLSSECRPAARQVFWVDQDTAAARVDVLPDGRMLYSGPAYRSWVPLDGISFTTAQFAAVADPDSRASNTKEGTQIELQDGFRNFNDGFRNAVWTRVGALCVLSGRVVANDIRGRVGTLPPKCRPARALQFNTFNGQWDAHPFAVQVNVMADGQVKWGASYAWDQSSGNFISLDGISFAVADATRAPVPNSAMQNYYVNPSSGEFGGVEFAVVGDACHVQGNVVVEKMNQIPGGNVLVLPASCRPADGRLILNAGQGSVFNRLDLETTGQLSLQAGETRFKFLSLSNVFFFRAAGTPLEMRSGWGTYGSGYRRPSFRRMEDSNLCIVSGLASGSAIGTMAVLPESCRPMERLQFSVNNHNFAGRIDVLPDGRLINVFQNRHSWISLDGISFVVPLDRQASAYPLVDAASMKSGGNLTLLSGFAIYQRGYADPALFEFGSLCMLQGMLRTPDNDVSHVVLQLPANSRCVPKGRIPFDRHTKADQTVRADLMADGQLRYVAGPGESDMFPLDGIVWPASDAPQGSLELAGRWVAMGRGYQEPGWIRQGSMCLLTGTIRTESDRLQDMTDLLANLPGDCRPADGRIILDANQQDDSFRVDALPDGQLVLAQPGARGKRFPFISLGGIAFFDKVKTMTLSSGYSPYNNGYRVPGFAAEGDLCALSGLAYAGSQRTMAMLPRECRPAARVWFNVYIGSSTRRVDVLPSGEVLWVSGSSSGWVSFDGIFFRRVPVTDSL